MKAAIKTAEGTFEVKEVDKPTVPRPDWVLARIKVAGICGTDLRHWKVHNHNLEGKIMGHEMAGEVVEVGEAVTNVKKGDRVVIETLIGDGTCEWCKAKQYNLCPHLYEVRMRTLSQAFAEYVAGPWDKFYKLPDHVSYEEATLLDTFSVSLHGIHLSGIKIGDKIAIIGAGPIGLSTLQLAKHYGADVLVADIAHYPLEVAKELGADVVVNTAEEDGLARLKAFTGDRGADITFECAGGESMSKTLPQAVSFTRIGGRVVVVGGFDEGPLSIPLDWQHMQKSEIQLLLSASYAQWGTKPEMQMSLDLLAQGKINAKRLITQSFPLDQINQAFETAADKDKNKSIFVGITI